MTDKQQDKARFGRAVQENLDSLYRVAVRLTGQKADAEDLVADAIVKAWAAYGKLEDHDRFRPWIFRIMHNCFFSDLRRRKVRPQEVPLVEAGEGYDDEIYAMLEHVPEDFLHWWGNPEAEYANKLIGEQIHKAIADLPDAFRATVVLINVEGLSYDEAAQVMGVPTGTVRSRMKRGRTLLQKNLWQQARDAGIRTVGLQDQAAMEKSS